MFHFESKNPGVNVIVQRQKKLSQMRNHNLTQGLDTFDEDY